MITKATRMPMGRPFAPVKRGRPRHSATRSGGTTITMRMLLEAFAPMRRPRSTRRSWILSKLSLTPLSTISAPNDRGEAHDSNTACSSSDDWPPTLVSGKKEFEAFVTTWLPWGSKRPCCVSTSTQLCSALSMEPVDEMPCKAATSYGSKLSEPACIVPEQNRGTQHARTTLAPRAPPYRSRNWKPERSPRKSFMGGAPSVPGTTVAKAVRNRYDIAKTPNARLLRTPEPGPKPLTRGAAARKAPVAASDVSTTSCMACCTPAWRATTIPGLGTSQ
mmetsp:Transcript_2444/g.8191  ORF Transcript_2444/g.8191 Transcript_2444/m.8191 type:complete len:276 (-) Transcript_2444:524-1351(-)